MRLLNRQGEWSGRPTSLRGSHIVCGGLSSSGFGLVGNLGRGAGILKSGRLEHPHCVSVVKDLVTHLREMTKTDQQPSEEQTMDNERYKKCGWCLSGRR